MKFSLSRSTFLSIILSVTVTNKGAYASHAGWGSNPGCRDAYVVIAGICKWGAGALGDTCSQSTGSATVNLACQHGLCVNTVCVSCTSDAECIANAGTVCVVDAVNGNHCGTGLGSDACADAGDCTNTDGYNYCNGGLCNDGSIGETCDDNVDCVSTFCDTSGLQCFDGANLGHCGANSDCASGYCDLIANQCDDAPAQGGGDPHYSLHFNQFLSVQSLCDLVLMDSPHAYDGLGVTIHARHAAPLEMNAGDEYTFISNLILQIGKERWEVQADGAKIFKDGEEYNLLENEARSGEQAAASGGFPYTVQMTAKGSRKNQIEYEFLFADRSKIVLRANRHFKMAFVEVSGRFGGAAIRGFLGTPEKKGLFGRDGALIATTPESADIEAYAQEWQVMESESKLFMDKNAFPQAPHKCVFVDSGHGFLETDDANLTNQLLRGSRRRLSEVNPEMKLAAEKACAHISESHKRHWCEEDVMKSGFEEIASEPFYGV